MLKPIVHSEEGYLEMSMNMAYGWALTHDDRFLSIMPPHFAGWLGVTISVLRAAASQVCVRFDPMRAGMLGSEVITPEVMDILFKMFPKFELMASLGATEVAISHTGVGHPRVKVDDGRLVGRPLPGAVVLYTVAGSVLPLHDGRRHAEECGCWPT
jgi:acyl-coenzyme A synthetase/AMP-(fatty) acid ligase